MRARVGIAVTSFPDLMKARAIWALFLLGLMGQMVFVMRAWRAWPSYPHMRGNSISRDSLQFRDLIEPILAAPRCEPSWKKSGPGTDLPGCLLPFLWSTPVFATHDIRSAVLVVIAFHVAAGLLLVRTLRLALGDSFTAFYLVVFWLSPWRLFHSGFIWEPNLLVLAAAAHLWCCGALREGPRPWPSFVLGAVLVLTLQVHLSAIFLVLLTALLLVKGQVRVSAAAVTAGVVAGGLPVLPAILAFFHGSTVSLASASGFPGRGFLYVLPVLRALLLWLRLGSLDVGRMYAGDSVSCVKASLFGSTADRLWCLVSRSSGILATASVAITLAAFWWWLRRPPAPAGPASERWINVYTKSALIALLVSAGLSPITLQTWHVVIAAPVACLPVTEWIVARWPFGRSWTRWAVIAFLVARLGVAGLLAFQYPGFSLVSSEVAERVQD